MKLVIEMELDNAAFEEAGAEEVRRILESVASRIPDTLHQTNVTLSLHDANGNWVGNAEITDRTEDPHDALSALSLCASWLEKYRPLEANKKSDQARVAIQAARAVLAQTK